MATHSSILAWRIHGQRSLVGYGPQGRKESDTTEIIQHAHLDAYLEGHLGRLSSTIRKGRRSSVAILQGTYLFGALRRQLGNSCELCLEEQGRFPEGCFPALEMSWKQGCVCAKLGTTWPVLRVQLLLSPSQTLPSDVGLVLQPMLIFQEKPKIRILFVLATDLKFLKNTAWAKQNMSAG